jgi:hypothetical protein
MLVGDIIQGIRSAITDMPGFLPAPANPTVANNAAASTLPNGVYLGFITFRTPWGETLPNATEFTITTTVGNPSIQITAPTLPPGASVMRVYLTLAGGSAGTEQQMLESATLPFTISTPGTAALVPTRNTAYIPDADGDSFSAGLIYQWFNDALKICSQICGGLPDWGGVATVSGQGSYVVPGMWRTISDVWYDGYPLAMDKRGNIFRRNPVTSSVLSQVVTSLFTERMVIEVWPQAARTAASSTLANAMASTDTSATLVSTAGFLLTNGFAQIGSEIVQYSGTASNILAGLIRGLAGGAPSAYSIGATVSEINLFFGGWRMYAPAFTPGQALLTIPVPVGWETMLPIYGLARVKLAEQNVQEYSTLKKDFEETMKAWWKTNKVTTGPRQVGEESTSLEVIPNLGGGWVIPAMIPILLLLPNLLGKMLS